MTRKRLDEVLVGRGLYPTRSRARDAIKPLRALWPGERDPHGLCAAFPLVFVMQNASSSKRTYYCAYDPLTARAESYDFG